MADLRCAERATLVRAVARGLRDSGRGGASSVVAGQGAAVAADLKRTLDCFPTSPKKRKVQPDLSDQGLHELAWLTDSLDLQKYGGFLHLVPRIVNVVSVRLLLPRPPPRLSLPRDPPCPPRAAR